ncbi:MAG: hypothetical protein V1660_01300 [archaeon]
MPKQKRKPKIQAKQKENPVSKPNKLRLIRIISVVLIGIIAVSFFISIGNKNTCPKNIIPDKILIFESQFLTGTSYTDDRYVIKTDKWADGTLLYIHENSLDYVESLKPHCVRGNESGKNSSYFYCKEATYDNLTRKENYTVNLVLEPIENEKQIVKGVLFNELYRNYKVISARCTRRG